MACRRTAPLTAVRELDHVRWVGGGSGAGKTTLTRRLAERFGLRVYSTDAAIAAHAARLNGAVAPLLDDFRGMDMDQRWVHRDPTTMFRTFPWFHGEGFELVIEDLSALATSGVILAPAPPRSPAPGRSAARGLADSHAPLPAGRLQPAQRA